MATNRQATDTLAFDQRVIDELADRLTEAVVERVLEAIRGDGLAARASEPQTWLDAQEVAKRLGVSREWVYEHAQELGAARIGNGPRPRLRFPPRVLEDHDAETSKATAEPSAQRPARSSGLIPIRGW